MEAAMPSPESMEIVSPVLTLQDMLGMSLDDIAAAQRIQTPMARVVVNLLEHDVRQRLDMSLDELIALDRASRLPKTRGGGSTPLRRRFFPPPLFGSDRCVRCCRLGHTARACVQVEPTCYNCGAVGHRVYECTQGDARVFLAIDLDEPVPPLPRANALPAVTISELMSGRVTLASHPASQPPTLASLCAAADQGLATEGTWALHERLDKEEDRRHEFKRGNLLEHDPVKYTQYLCGFINGMGGRLYLGVADDGIVCGLPLGRPARDQFRCRHDAVVQRMRPPPRDLFKVAFEPVRNAPAETVVVLVTCYPAQGNVHATSAGTVHVREQGSLRTLSFEEQQALILQKHRAFRRKKKEWRRSQRGGSSSSGLSSSSASSDDESVGPYSPCASSLSPSPRRTLGHDLAAATGAASLTDPSTYDGGSSTADSGRRLRRRIEHGGAAVAALPAVAEEDEPEAAGGSEDFGMDAAVAAVHL